MAERGLSGEEIAVLVDVARTSGCDLTPGQRQALDELVSLGLVKVASADNPSSYDVTPEGQSLLDQRGVGANES